MTAREACEGAIAVFAVLGVAALVSEPVWRPAKAAAPPPILKPFSARMGCPEWREGLSRSVTIIATEDASGVLTGMRCIRVRDRGVARGVGT